MREEQSKNNNKNKKKQKERYEYEYCKVCRINHDQGRRHNYFPSHVSSLSSFLSRFLSKLHHLRLFLHNPISLLPHHSHLNRLWCVFCDRDILEIGSAVACCNAINHLASADHLKNLKSFLWKFGGKMDQVDSFRVSEGDLAKWEKKCKSLNSVAASEGSGRSLIGPSNEMRDIRSPVQNSLTLLIMVLHQISLQKHALRGIHLVQTTHQAHADSRMIDGGSCLQGLHNLTQISSAIQGNEGNVHTGASPPWFDSSETNLLGVGHKFESGSKNVASSHQKSGKIQKLNPKRVGAAWAEKRKIELEMEKRGEFVANNFDDNWLPNFGSVWQSGTRKESKKEFDAENKHPLKTVFQSETLVEIQPYVSKRKRKDTGSEA